VTREQERDNIFKTVEAVTWKATRTFGLRGAAISRHGQKSITRRTRPG